MARFFAVILLPVLFILSGSAIKTADACFWCGQVNIGGYVVTAPPPIIASPPPILYPYFNYSYNGGYNYSYNTNYNYNQNSNYGNWASYSYPYYGSPYYNNWSNNYNNNYNWGNYNYWPYR